MSILIIEREKQCTGASECISRPMTKEEKRKYGSVKPTKEKPVFHIPETPKREVEKVKGIKITPPEKEKLIEVLAGVKGKTGARSKTSTMGYVAKYFSVSIPTIIKWTKQYGIEFDAEGYVITNQGEKLIEEAAMQMGKEEDGLVHAEVKYELKYEPIDIFPKPLDDEERTDTITITGQETKEVTKKLGYAEHDVGNATVIYDFRADLVKIVTPSNNEMTPEVARAVAEDILDILGHE